MKTKNDAAISETIGVVLMVALTVIMSALLASMAMGLVSDNIHPSKNIIMKITRVNQTFVSVLYMGGDDQAKLTSVRIVWPSGSSDTDNSPTIGRVYGPQTIDPTITNNHIQVIGKFMDNSEQILVDSWL